MIDIQHEQLIRLGGVPKLLPPNERTGRRVHLSAIHRWVQYGRLGAGGRRVRLETLRLGGSTYTSLEALQRFANELSAANPERTSDRAEDGSVRSRRMAAVGREVDRILGVRGELIHPAATSRA